ncbi:MAG: hypothetical protein HQK58_04005, partial [Deltaproteobacteria bacterium]|nr:hypothetical protein [Deltaproteobacteria bacterium]
MAANRFGVFIACILTWWSLSFSPQLFAQSPVGSPPGPGSAAMAPPSSPATKPGPPNLKVDKKDLDNGGNITVTGKGTPGQPVFLEVPDP